MRMLHVFLSTVVAVGCLASCAPKQHSVVAQSAEKLMVSGQLTMRERLALSPTAVAEVALIEAGNPDAPALGQQRIPFNGKQVPINFNLAVEESRLLPGGNYILRGAIEDDGGNMRWTVETPVAITSGATQVDVGTLVAVRDQP